MNQNQDPICADCGDKAEYFHSTCCDAHFEGIIKDGKYLVVCENCHKVIGELKT